MDRPTFLNGPTPERNVSTPQQPTTAARLLLTEVDDTHAPTTRSFRKMSLASTQDSDSFCNANEQTQRHIGKTTGHNIAVPPLVVESLNISSIAPGSPSPVSEWSNTTEKHQRPNRTQLQQQNEQRLKDTADSDDSTHAAPADVRTQPPEHLQAGGSISSPTACSSSAKETSTNNNSQLLERASASTPVLGVSHSSRVSRNLEKAFVEVVPACATTGAAAVANRVEEDGESHSVSVPAGICQTQEKVADGQDLPKRAMPSTSIGGTTTPTLLQRKGNVWLCEVGHEDEEQNGGGPDGTPHHRKHPFRTEVAVSTVGHNGSEVRSGRLTGSDDNVHDSALLRAAKAYVPAHPSAEPFSGASESAALSPMHTRELLSDRDFILRYPLFLPHALSPHQRGLQLSPAQITPSSTELQTHVFSESTTEKTQPHCGGKVPLSEGNSNGSLSTQMPPNTQHCPPHHRPCDPEQPIAAESPIQFHLTVTASHPFLSSSETNMDTRVFRSGMQAFSPIRQRRHTSPSRVTFVGEGSADTSHKFTLDHPCSPLHTPTTPMHRLRQVAPPSFMDNSLEDTFFSLHSSLDAAGHSSLRTPRTVSALAGGSSDSRGSASMASSPLIPSFDGGSYEARSLSVSGAAAPQEGTVDIVHRANTPKSPHTPQDRRTPGPVGLYGSSYASLSEYSYAVSNHHHHRQLPSQPMTPQKSARRNYSRQTTPSQSFRSKVQCHSFQSQQRQFPPQQTQHFNSYNSGSGAAKWQVNTSNSSFILGEATTVAERDYLAPSRNPFSLYRSFHLYTNPLFKPDSFINHAGHLSQEDSTSSDVTIRAHDADPPVTESQSRYIKELSSAVLRPDAAVVVYEQLIPAPSRAPGSHCPGAKASTPSQAAFDLLLHAPQSCHHVLTPGNLSLSLNTHKAMHNQGGNDNGSTGTAAVEGGHKDEGSVKEAATHLAASPSRLYSSTTAVPTGRTVPHRETCFPIPSPTSLYPKISLVGCSPHNPPAMPAMPSPQRTSSCILGTRQTVTAALDAPVGLRMGEPCLDAMKGSLHSDLESTNAAASLALLNDPREHEDTLNSFAAPSNMTADNLLFSTSDNSPQSTGGCSDTEEGTPSPPPRQPTKRLNFADSDPPSPRTVNSLFPERQLQFDAGDTKDKREQEDQEEQEASTININGDAAAVATYVASPGVAPPPLTGTSNETSAGTDSRTGLPSFLQTTVANANPFSERTSSPLQPQPSLHADLHARAQEGRTLTTALLLPPSTTDSAAPAKFFDVLATPDLPSRRSFAHHLLQPPLFSPSHDHALPHLSIESHCAHVGGGGQQSTSRAFPNDPICSSNEAASFLSRSAYQTLDSVLDPLEVTDTSEEEIPGDRFQAHHDFQFLHYVEAALETPFGAACETSPRSALVPTTTTTTSSNGAPNGRPIPLSVEVNGVTWLAVHRLNGLPYAVKEVPVVAFNMAELQCLTLSISGQYKLHGESQLEDAARIAPYDLLEVEDYLARYYSVRTPPQDDTKPVVHLLQLEYFPGGSVQDVAHQAKNRRLQNKMPASLSRSVCDLSSVLFNRDFWEQVVQQGLRGLRVLHHARLLHGCPLPCSLFFAGHTSRRLHVKWSCFGSARMNADVYPTESLPPWISEAVSRLYRQNEGKRAVPADVIEVAVFCLGVLELVVKDADERRRVRGLAVPPHAVASQNGLCHLEWIELMVGQCNCSGHEGSDDAYSEEEVQLQGFMQFLWNTANSYRTADEVLAQMGVRIDPAMHTVEQLYQFELDRLSRQLQERKRRKKSPQTSSNSSFLLDHHEPVTSVHSQVSVELPPALQKQRAECKGCTSRTSTSTNNLSFSPNVAAGHGLAQTISCVPSLDEPQFLSALHKSPQLFPRRTSAPCGPMPRATFLELSTNRHHLTEGRGGGGGPPGSGLFLSHSTAYTKPIIASVPILSPHVDRSVSEVSARVTARRQGKSNVHPRVREAAQKMLMNALMCFPLVKDDALTPSSLIWKALLAPVIHALRLRGWMTLYAGIPLTVTGEDKLASCSEEEVLQTLLTSLRPMTSFE